MRKSDFEQLQKEVLAQYALIKDLNQKEIFFEDLADRHSTGPPEGRLTAFFRNMATMFGRAAFSEIHQSHKEAEEFIANTEFRALVCSNLNTVVTKGAMKEEDIVREVVKALVDDPFRDRFSLDVNAERLAWISFAIVQVGIENYCRGIEIQP